MKAITEKKQQDKASDTAPQRVTPDQLPDDKRDNEDSLTDWNAENNESGRRK